MEHSHQLTSDEENKDDDSMPSNPHVDIEWVDLGSGAPINSEKRYLYNWYRSTFKVEALQSLGDYRMQYPFPNVYEYNDISENILKFVLFKIRSDQFAIPK